MPHLSKAISILLTLALSGTAATHGAELQLTPNVPVITTRGDAAVQVQPDTFTISAEVQTYNKDLNQAYAANDSTAAAVLAVAKKYNVKDEAVQTGHINVSTEFSDGRSHTVRSHYVRRSITIKTRDVSQIRKLIADVIAAGANSISSVSYSSSEVRKHKDNARLMALKAAKEKAELLAGSLGNKVGKAICIEGDIEVPSPYMSSMQNTLNVLPPMEAGESSGISDGVALGAIPIKASIRATFELQ